jgi:hypothetical protein
MVRLRPGKGGEHGRPTGRMAAEGRVRPCRLGCKFVMLACRGTIAGHPKWRQYAVGQKGPGSRSGQFGRQLFHVISDLPHFGMDIASRGEAAGSLPVPVTATCGWV